MRKKIHYFGREFVLYVTLHRTQSQVCLFQIFSTLLDRTHCFFTVTYFLKDYIQIEPQISYCLLTKFLFQCYAVVIQCYIVKYSALVFKNTKITKVKYTINKADQKDFQKYLNDNSVWAYLWKTDLVNSTASWVISIMYKPWTQSYSFDEVILVSMSLKICIYWGILSCSLIYELVEKYSFCLLLYLIFWCNSDVSSNASLNWVHGFC